MSETGHISIHAENILPIIKKWLYSEKEIFLRELISNASDAVQKLEKLCLIGEVKTDVLEPKITVAIDKDKKTLSFTDTGLGMTAEEVKKYIAQVAFSSLEEFVEKYKDKDLKDQNIGHFGLGFYSAYMVSTKVEIDTLSYQEGAKAVKWTCDGSIEYTLSDSDKKEVGTTITLHIADDSHEMLNESNIQRLLQTYCGFIKYPIEMAEKTINDPTPLWTKSPSQLEEKDYLEFFHKMFPMNPEPLFWVHLNLDYPFKLSGILYFPKLQHELDASSGDVKIFCNQVFVAENSKDLLPDWLTLLKGAIDCPDLPLNVSRSYLQKDAKVQKIAEHVVKKIADKLNGMAKNEVEQFEKYWTDIHTFIKFGMLKDEKFFDRMKDQVIYKNSQGNYTKLDDYLERMKEKTNDKIIYADDKHAQASMLNLLDAAGIEAIITESVIDSHFIPYMEMKSASKYKFVRIDSDESTHLLGDDSDGQVVDPTDNKNALEKLEVIFKDAINKDKVKVKCQTLKSENVPAMLLFDENMRRMKEMMSMSPNSILQQTADEAHTLVINYSNPAIKNLLTLSKDESNKDKVKLMVNQVYDLAMIQQGVFTPEMMQGFVDRSSQILQQIH